MKHSLLIFVPIILFVVMFMIARSTIRVSISFSESVILSKSSEEMEAKLFQANQTATLSPESIVMIIQCVNITEDIVHYISLIENMNLNVSIYLTTESGTFQEKELLLSMESTIHARIIHCSLLICDNIVFSIVAYEEQCQIIIIRWMDLLALNQTTQIKEMLYIQQTLLHMSITTLYIHSNLLNNPVVAFVSSKVIRSIMSHPCFETIYGSFNVIRGIVKYYEDLLVNPKNRTCTRLSNQINHESAVVLTAYKRDYFKEVLTKICIQTIPPTWVLLIQNMAHISINRSIIPSVCLRSNIQFQHIWLSNWNSFSYMRHFIPIPTSIHTTILVDDDMTLTNTTLEHGMGVMRRNQCVATERGRLIDRNKNHKHWQFRTSHQVTSLTNVDYAFIPQFLDTEWRKSYCLVSPFSRRYGDILFTSIALQMHWNIRACVIPQFSFFIHDNGEDELSTSKSHSEEYDALYTDIASNWIKRGFIPLMEQ